MAEITDLTNQKVEDSSSKEPTPEMKEALEAKEKLGSLLELYGADSVKDLETVLKSGTELNKKLGNANIDAILEKAGKLDRYEEYWEEQERLMKNKGSGDDDLDLEDDSTKKLKALEKELYDIKSGVKKITSEKDAERALKEAELIVEKYKDEVNSFMGSQKDVPEEYRSFAATFFGVENPFNEIDITDKVAVRKMVKEGIPKLQEFEQAVIKRYVDGKIKIPTMTRTEPSEPSDKKPIVKNLKEAKAFLLDAIPAIMRGKSSP